MQGLVADFFGMALHLDVVLVHILKGEDLASDHYIFLAAGESVCISISPLLLSKLTRGVEPFIF